MDNQAFLRNELLDLQVKADELDAENIKLCKENEKYEYENKKLKSKISELNNYLSNTVDRKEFDELNDKYAKLTEKFEKMDKNFKLLKKENDAINNTYDLCLKNCNEIEDKVEIYKRENSELKSNLNELKSISKATIKDAAKKNEKVEKQNRIISALQEENESLKTHLNYLKEQNKKNVSVLSFGGDSFLTEQYDMSVLVPESMDIIVETKLRDCQKKLEETESKLQAKQRELDEQGEKVTKYQAESESRKIEICELEKQKIELEEQLKCELNNLDQQLLNTMKDNDRLNKNLLDKEEQLKSSVEMVDQFNEKLVKKEEEISRLTSELNAVREQRVEEELKMSGQMQHELNELTGRHREELDLIRLHEEQKLNILTGERDKQEEEQMKMRAEVDGLKSRISELQSNYDRLLDESEKLKKLIEIKDNKLIELDSENERLNIEFNKFGQEIGRTDECLDEEITLTQAVKLNELTEEKEAILLERNELEKQVEELKSALSHASNEYSMLMKRHQDEMFKLSEAMSKKQNDCKLRSDMQIVFKELKCKEEQLIELQSELEKRKELTQSHIIAIEKLKADDREKNHTVYMLKQKLNEQENKIKSDEVAINKLKVDLKCAEDSFDLERKTKERYYREMTELERRRCLECTKLERSNSITFNARDQTLLVKNPSNPQLIQKIPNPSKYMMEDEEGQFMINGHIKEVRKRKTEYNDQDEFNKRLNILQQRNAKQLPHLKTSYAIEFQDYQTQEVNSVVLNEKIKNSEKFVIDENSRMTRNPSILRQFSSLRFRKA